MNGLGGNSRARASRFLLVLLALLGVAAFFLVRPLLTGAIFGIVVGFLLQGPYQRLAKRVRFPRIVAFFTVALIVLALDIPLLILGYQLVLEARGFADAVQSSDFLPSIERGLARLGVPQANAEAFVTQTSAQVNAYLQSAALPTLNLVGQLLMNTGVFLFVLYYTLVDGPRLVKWIHDALPLSPEDGAELITAVAQRMRILFLGTFLVAICHGALAGLVWWLLGFPDPFFWGAVMTILSMIPALGTGVVMFPAGVFGILVGRVWQGAALILWAFAVAPLVDNLVRALFIGRGESGVHPVLVLVGTVGGLALFGPAGFLLGPLALSMIDPVLGAWEKVRAPREFHHAE